MSDLFIDEEDKIPFDNEPIERKKSSDYKKELKQRNSTNSFSSNAKFLISVILVAVIVVGALMGYSIINLNRQVEKLKQERSDYTMNISADGGNSSYSATKGMLSTVSVSASSTNNGGTAETFFSSAMASRGSGVILEVDKEAGDAYIITNFHVVSSTSSLKPFNYRWVLLWDSVNPIPATYVGGSYTYDIAVLKIEGSEEIKKSSCASVTIGNSTKVGLGEEVVAIGNSMARNLRISTGVVAVEEELMGSATYSMYISHSADVNSGNSGGGLYNNSGELIGIVNAKFMDVNETTGELIYNEIIHGMNYAIPSEIAVSVARNLIRNNGTLQKPTTGLTLGNTLTYNAKNYTINENGQGYTTYDLVISKSTGNFKRDDKLVSMSYEYGGKTITVEVNRLFSLESNIYNLSKNSVVTFVVERNSIEVTVKLTIETLTSVS